MIKDVYGPYGQDEPEFFGNDAVEAAEPVVPLPDDDEEVTKTRPKLTVDLSDKNASMPFPMLVLLLLIGAVGSAAAFWAASYPAWKAFATDPEPAQAAAAAEGTAEIPPIEEAAIPADPQPRRSYTDRPRERFDSIHWDKNRRKRLEELRKERREREKDRLEALKEERKRWEEDLKEFYKRGERDN